MKKRFFKHIIPALLASALMLTGCVKSSSDNAKKDEGEVIILAAASLKDVCAELETEYKKDHNVTLTFSFGSSGALQTQIEEGAPADVFFSAAEKQWMAEHDSLHVGYLNNYLPYSDTRKDGTVTGLVSGPLL